MPEIEFIGDWDPAQVDQAVVALRKSLGMGAAQGADSTLETTVIGLSPRQQKLIDLLRKASHQSPESQDPPEWDDVYLTKSAWVGQRKITADGRVLTLNSNRRWQRSEEPSPKGSPSPAAASALSAISFPITDGSYGRGVYLPVRDSAGDGLKLRVRLGVDPDLVIPDAKFHELADNYAQDLDVVLDGHGIRGIAELGPGEQINQLVVRDPADLSILGSIGGSHVPRQMSFAVVDLNPTDDGILLDIELVEQEALNKAARTTFPSTTGLKGSRLQLGGEVQRSTLRAAVGHLRRWGVDLGGIALKTLPGVPDFASGSILISELDSHVIYLCPGDIGSQLRAWVGQLTHRLERAVAAEAMLADEALSVLKAAALLMPCEWLAHRILTMIGANRIPDSDLYRKILAGRGLAHWGTEALIRECIGEDYRTLFTGLGIPNLITLEWDCLCPEYARMGQHLIKNALPQH